MPLHKRVRDREKGFGYYLTEQNYREWSLCLHFRKKWESAKKISGLTSLATSVIWLLLPWLYGTRNLAIANRSRSSVLPVEYNSKEIISHIWRLTAVIDFVHDLSCIFEIQTTKPFTVVEMVFKGHSRSSAMSSFSRSLGLPKTGKVL